MKKIAKMAYVCVLVILLFGFCQAVLAQPGQTVKGVVRAQDGSPLPAANLALTSKIGGQPLTAESDEEGAFEFPNVPPGEYVLRVTAAGFASAEQTINVGSDALPRVRVKLKVSNVSEKVTVTAQPALLAQENQSQIHLDEHMLMNMPVRDADPLAVPSLFLNPAVVGSSGPTIVVDGVESSSSSLDLPTSSVKSVTVDENPYSAEFGRPGKGRLEVTTKRGVHSRFRGNVLAMFRNSALDARNAFATDRPLQQRGIGEAELDGPLAKEATFFVAARYHMFNNSSVVSAEMPTGPLTENVRVPERKTHLFGRIDDRISKSHKISLLYLYKDNSLDNQGVGGFDLPERATDVFEHENEFKILETATPSADSLNQIRLTYKEERADTTSDSNDRAILVPGAFNSGGAQINRRLIEKMGFVEDVASIVHGRNSFQLGMGAKLRYFFADDRSNFGGTFTFSSLADYKATPPSPCSTPCPELFTMNIGNPAAYFQQHELYSFLQDDIHLRPNFSLMLGLRHEFQSNVAYYQNLAPRVAFAYSPGGGPTVLRGGFGIFYERQPFVMEQQNLLYGGTANHQIVISNPAYPDPFAPGQAPTDAIPSVVSIAPDMRFPYLMQGSLAIEQKLGRAQNFLTFEVAAVRGLELYRSRNINAPLPGTTIHPDPNFINIDQFESSGSSRSYMAAVTYKGHTHKLDVMTQYTLSRTLNDTSGISALPANNYDLRSEWGRSDDDRRHRFNLVFLYRLPAGFQASSIFSVWSGAPYNITTGHDDNGDTVANDRPPGLWRNAGRGPGYANIDTRLSRRWRLRKHEHPPSVDVAVDAFNILNHVNLKTYIGTMTSPFFGTANSALPARQLQLSLRFIF